MCFNVRVHMIAMIDLLNIQCFTLYRQYFGHITAGVHMNVQTPESNFRRKKLYAVF